MKPLIGVHDFNNFRMSDCGSKTSIREIYSIELFEEDQKLIVEIRGNSFLKSQIRIMIGTALEIYFGNRDKNYLIDMLNNPEKKYIKRLQIPLDYIILEVNY